MRSIYKSPPVIETAEDRTLTPQVHALLEELCKTFDARRLDLMEQRARHRQMLSEGHIHFLEETTHIRRESWSVDALPEQLLERRVELIGGATRSEVINGLNSGAKSYIADLWNFTAADTWSNLRAHRTLDRAAKLDMAYLAPDGDRVRINPKTTTRLMVAPRPLFVPEPSVLFQGNAVPAAFVDLVMLVLNCGNTLTASQGGIYLLLRDIQTHLEARLYAQLFDALEEHMGSARGTIRATIMIDSISAVMEADEILFELSHHAAGMSLDPQGYAADHIALFHGEDRAVLPDRENIGLNAPFLRAAGLHIIGICHRRGCHAIGPASFVLPPKDPINIRSNYLEMLADKEREAVDGYDGTMVVHSETVNAAMMEYNKSMPRANQLYYQRSDDVQPSDMVRRPEGSITVDSLVAMIRTALRSMVRMGDGRGWVVQGSRLHDRSSIRLSTRLLWQWNKSRKGVITSSGLDVHDDLLKYLVKKEAEKMVPESEEKIKKLRDPSVTRLLDAITGEHLPQDPLN